MSTYEHIKRKEDMCKIIKCPECGSNDQPVRNDALVCSPKCRQAKFRRLKREAKAAAEKEREEG